MRVDGNGARWTVSVALLTFVPGCATLLGIEDVTYVSGTGADAGAVQDARPSTSDAPRCVFGSDASRFDPPPCTFGP